MTYELRLLPEVEEDAFSGYLWYEERSSGLGDQFLDALYAGVSTILSSPLLYRVVHQDIRRRLLGRFPYAVYFTVEGDQLLVLGVFHCARDPQSIDTELLRREE